jgi:hypothetical protein
LAAEEQKNAGQ